MLIRHTLLYMPAQLIAPLFQFIAAVAWTHWLAPEAYGVLAFILAAQELAFVFCLSWWTHATLRYSGEAREGLTQRRYLLTENSILAVTSVLQGVVILATLALTSIAVTPGLAAATIAFTVSRSLNAHLGDRARAAGAIGAYTAGQLAGPVLGLVLSALFLLAWPASATLILTGFAIAQILGLMAQWVAMRLGLRVGLIDRALFMQAFRFGIPLVISGVIGWISVNGIRVIVEQMQGVEAVGLISVGWGLGQRVASVGAMLVTAAAFPLAVKALRAGRRAEALDQLSRNGILLFGLLAPMAAGVTLMTRPLVEVMVAGPFQAMTIAILPVAVAAGALRNMRVHFLDQVFILLESTPSLMIVNSVEALSVVVLTIIGIYHGGPVYGAVGCLAGIAVGTALCGAMAVVRFSLRLPWAHFARIVLAVAAMVAVLQWADLLRFGIAGMTAEVVVGALVYGVVLAALNPLPARLALTRLGQYVSRPA